MAFFLLLSRWTRTGGHCCCALGLPRLQRWADYEACIKRVAASGDEEAHCTGQYLDFWKCVDACVRSDPSPSRLFLGISPLALRFATWVLPTTMMLISTTFRPRLEETLITDVDAARPCRRASVQLRLFSARCFFICNQLTSLTLPILRRCTLPRCVCSSTCAPPSPSTFGHIWSVVWA